MIVNKGTIKLIVEIGLLVLGGLKDILFKRKGETKK